MGAENDSPHLKRVGGPSEIISSHKLEFWIYLVGAAQSLGPSYLYSLECLLLPVICSTVNSITVMAFRYASL